MPAYFDPAQSTDARAWADSLANQAYYEALSRGSDAAAALASARFAWQQKMDESSQTGMWNGQYNMPSQQSFANMFGEWMPQGPQAGQETMAREGQTYGQQQGFGAMYGQYYAPGTGPAQGQQTLAGQNQANQLGLSQAGLTGYYVAPGQTGQGQQTLAGQAQQWGQGFSEQQFAETQRQNQQSNAQNYLQLLAGLRGPADWAKYQQVLGSTPGGMRDLAAAAMGQYVPGGGATTGMQPQAVSLQSMMGDISGNPYSGNGAPLTMPGQQGAPSPYAQAQYGQITASPDGMRGMQSPQPTQQQYTQGVQQQQPGQYAAGYTQPPTMAATAGPAGQYDQKLLSSQTPQQPVQQPTAQNYTGYYGDQMAQRLAMQEQGGASYAAGTPTATSIRQPGQAWGSGIGIGPQQATPAQQQQGLGGGANTMGQLPAPNQIASQSWKNLAPSQQQMLLGSYEAQGWDKNDVTALMNQSLPKYTAGSPGVGSYRLQ